MPATRLWGTDGHTIRKWCTMHENASHPRANLRHILEMRLFAVRFNMMMGPSGTEKYRMLTLYGTQRVDNYYIV